jgi:predicted nucleic acid-binding protein
VSRTARAGPVVLDTNIVSYLFKSNAYAQQYRPLLDGRTHVVSFQTVAELEAWTLERNWGARRISELRSYLSRYGVLDSNELLSRRWAQVRLQAKQAGRPIDIADAWIAATALELNVPLVTHNPNDFVGVAGLQVLTVAPIANAKLAVSKSAASKPADSKAAESKSGSAKPKGKK